jgi:hypothetical protein
MKWGSVVPNAVYDISENARFERTVLISQVQLQTRNNCYRKLWDVKTCFQKRNNEKSLIFDRFCNVRSGVISGNDSEYSGHLSTIITGENVWIKVPLHGNRNIIIYCLANEVGILLWSCWSVLTRDMNMQEIAAKFMPLFVLTMLGQHDCYPAPSIFPRLSATWLPYFSEIPVGTEEHHLSSKIITGCTW